MPRGRSAVARGRQRQQRTANDRRRSGNWGMLTLYYWRRGWVWVPPATRNDAVTAPATNVFSSSISFWQAGHLICIPAHSGPQEICCEQCGQEIRSLISQLAYAGNTVGIGTQRRCPSNSNFLASKT